MNVIIKEPGKLGYEKDIPNTLEALQAEVGGFIEVVRVNSRLVAIVNEEGRQLGLRPNVLNLFGTIVFCGEDGEEFADIDQESSDLLRIGFNPVMKGKVWSLGGGVSNVR